MKVYKTDEFMKENQTVHLFEFTAKHPEPIHSHDFIELVYILSGNGIHEINGKQYSLSHGDFLFMNRGCSHSFSSEEGFHYVNILLSPKILAHAENALALLSLTAFNELCTDADFGTMTFFGKERAEAEIIIRAMLEEYKEKPTHWEQVLSDYLHILLTKLLRKTEEGVDQKELGEMWRSLSQYIDQNIGEKLTLSSLAEKCFYNPSYFSRSFKEKFGMNLTEYVTRKRLDRAIALLSSTELSTERICEQAGFPDRAALKNAFTKYLGASPKDFRKK